ncbi:MAG: HAMP domain-containing sensor histidine kinase, partial [Planctomycetota bacterium]
LDVALLTVLLHYTGGPENPFAVLYAVHVAMATVVLGAKWGWLTVGVVLVCFAMLSLVEPAETAEPLTPSARRVGQFAALLLELALIAYFIGRVLTSLRQREVELAAARERAAQGEQLAALTTLAAGAAHELGTPLGTIAVVSKEMEFLAAKHRINDLVEDAQLVRQQVDRCRGILEHLRGDVAGRSSDEASHCRLGDLLDAVRDQVPPTRRDRFRVTGTAANDVALAAEVLAPQRAMEQAIGFLVDNAFDASDASQTVVLAVDFVDGDAPAGQARVQFVVRDEGVGMIEELVRRAQEPFYTTKDPGQGMGLGLFLVRLIADRNCGSFVLESEVGVGTKATFIVPCESNAGTPSRDKLSRVQAASTGE